MESAGAGRYCAVVGRDCLGYVAVKVNSVRPGIVKWNDAGDKFAYTLRYYGGGRTWETASGYDYPTASAAKQAMREKARHEEKRHGVSQ